MPNKAFQFFPLERPYTFVNFSEVSAMGPVMVKVSDT